MTRPPRPGTPLGRRPSGSLVLVFVFALTPATAAPPDDDPAVRADRAKLQGAWVLESMEINGRKAEEDQTRGWMLVVEGDQYNPGSSQTSIEYTYRINPARNPKSIDLIPHDGPHRGRVLRGIYAVDRDRFTICRARMPEGERPAGFITRPDSGLVATVWKRQKP